MIGCLCIHGFTGAPYEVQPLADHLKSQMGITVKVITLPGHGEKLQLKGVTHEDWVFKAEKELEILLEKCDAVDIIGFSMGGLIAAYLAANYPIRRLVLLSAAARYINPRQMLLDFKGMLADILRGKAGENHLYQRYKKKISATPLSATIEFQLLVRKLRPVLKDVEVPTLIIQGKRDGVVPLKSAQFIYDAIQSSRKEIHYLSRSEHHVCHGDDQDKLFMLVEDFLQNKL